MGILLGVEPVESTAIHNRSIRTDSGWKILLGRGLDIFQRGASSPFDQATKYQRYRELGSFRLTHQRETREKTAPCSRVLDRYTKGGRA